MWCQVRSHLVEKRDWAMRNRLRLRGSESLLLSYRPDHNFSEIHIYTGAVSFMLQVDFHLKATRSLFSYTAETSSITRCKKRDLKQIYRKLILILGKYYY